MLRIGSFDDFDRFDDDNPEILFSYIRRSCISDLLPRDDIHHDCRVRECNPKENFDRQFAEHEGYLADIANGSLRPALHELLVWPASRDREWKEWKAMPNVLPLPFSARRPFSTCHRLRAHLVALLSSFKFLRYGLTYLIENNLGKHNRPRRTYVSRYLPPMF